MVSKVRLFSLMILISGIVTLLSGMNEPGGLDPAEFVSGAIVVGVGLFMFLYAKRDEKMKAIGFYAMAFGIAKIIIGIDDGDLVGYLKALMGLLFILFGYTYYTGLSKRIWTKIITSIVLIALDAVGLFSSNPWIVAENLVEIVLLFFFILLLDSKEVSINTKRAKKKMAKKMVENYDIEIKETKTKYKEEAKAAKAEGDKEKAKQIKLEGKRKISELKDKRKKTFEKGRNAHYSVDKNGNVTMDGEDSGEEKR